MLLHQFRFFPPHHNMSNFKSSFIKIYASKVPADVRDVKWKGEENHKSVRSNKAILILRSIYISITTLQSHFSSWQIWIVSSCWLLESLQEMVKKIPNKIIPSKNHYRLRDAWESGDDDGSGITVDFFHCGFVDTLKKKLRQRRDEHSEQVKWTENYDKRKALKCPRSNACLAGNEVLQEILEFNRY